MMLLNAYFEFEPSDKVYGSLALTVSLYDGSEYLFSKRWYGDDTKVLKHLGEVFWRARSAVFFADFELPGPKTDENGDTQLPLWE